MFIGRSAIVMPNTEIGDHVIVGAGSVVRGRVPPYSILVGNPATPVGDVREFASRWKEKVDAGDVRSD